MFPGQVPVEKLTIVKVIQDVRREFTPLKPEGPGSAGLEGRGEEGCVKGTWQIGGLQSPLPPESRAALTK